MSGPATEAGGKARVLRVLQVSAFFRGHGGGIETVADELAHRVPCRDFVVHWMAGDHGGEAPIGPFPVGLEVEAVRSFDPLESRIGLPMPLWGPHALRRLWRAVGRADLVHIHDYLYQPSLMALLFAWLRNKPTVITQHIGEIPFASQRARALLEALNRHLGARVLARAGRTAFVGAPVQNYFEKRTRFERPPKLVPNGVDLDRFRPGTDDRVLRSPEVQLLFVGRFVEKKGLRLLVPCLDLPGVHWTFVGWGPQSPVERSNERVTLAGRLAPEAIVPHYQQADLLVLPSTGEGFPLVVQEALACGTPVLVSSEVAAAFPALDDACVFAVDLQAPDPSVRLREVLAELAANPTRLSAARVAARGLAGQWSWDRCAEAYRELYRCATRNTHAVSASRK